MSDQGPENDEPRYGRRAGEIPVEVQAAAVETVAQVAEAIAVAEDAKEAKPNDVVVYAVRGIIVITAAALVGTIGLLSQGKQAPDGVIAISSAGMGALSTLLTVRARGDR